MACRIVYLAFLLLPLTRAQQAPAFEVASVKLSAGGDGLSVNSDPGMVSYSRLTLRMLAAIANRVDMPRVAGGPAWLDEQHYDVVAKLPAGATKDQVPEMLNRLLEERFKLAVHRETKEQKVLALVVAKGGPKLTRSEETRGSSGNISPGGLKVRAATMAILAGMLKYPAHSEVVDRTGIAGTYDVELNWRKDDNADGPDLYTAIQEQLGLKLEPGRAPIDTVVVDRAERIPGEN